MNKKNLPIAVFDSGLGGISVLRELIKLMPQELFYLRLRLTLQVSKSVKARLLI